MRRLPHNDWGIAKIYETYVGKKQFQPSSPVFNRIQQAGAEFGATTGRVRQCNWLNMQQLNQAILMNGVNKLIFNKMDVLREVGRWGVNNPNISFRDEETTIKYLRSAVPSCVDEIFFSDSPEFV